MTTNDARLSHCNGFAIIDEIFANLRLINNMNEVRV